MSDNNYVNQIKEKLAEINAIIEKRHVSEPDEEKTEEVIESLHSEEEYVEEKPLWKVVLEKKEAEAKKKPKRKYKRAIPYDVREIILKRDNFQCRFCGSESRLQIHHIQYRSNGGDNEPENLITLCEKCHYEIHKNEPVGKLMKKRMS